MMYWAILIKEEKPRKPRIQEIQNVAMQNLQAEGKKAFREEVMQICPSILKGISCRAVNFGYSRLQPKNLHPSIKGKSPGKQRMRLVLT